MLRWSLVFLQLFFGALKWTAAEAQAILPFMLNSPLLAWLGRAFEPQHASELIGVIEVTIAVLIALRQWAPRLTMIGGFLAIGMFLTTLSFLVTTPNLGDGGGISVEGPHAAWRVDLDCWRGLGGRS